MMSGAVQTALFLELLAALVVLVANLYVFLRVLPDGTAYTNHWHLAMKAHRRERPSGLATTAWVMSVSCVWLGPLLFVAAPASLGLGLVALHKTGAHGRHADRIAARMAVANGIIFCVLGAVFVMVWRRAGNGA
jgi:hypothetical protein